MQRKARLISCLLPAFTLLACVPASATPTCADPVGAWKNQLKSTLTITAVDAATGQITGDYISPSGTQGQKFPMVGWLNKVSAVPKQDNAVIISFAVQWGSFGTITSWTGVCRKNGNKEEVVALWHLGNPVAKYEWGHVLSGQDIFHPL